MKNLMIEPLNIEGNQYRPHVDFDNQTGTLVISGRSILENSIAFFEPVMAWLVKYIESPAPLTVFNIQLEYFNTSTSKYILTIIEQLEELHHGGYDVEVNWFYGDDDMKELGEDYKHIVDLPFELHPFNFIA